MEKLSTQREINTDKAEDFTGSDQKITIMRDITNLKSIINLTQKRVTTKSLKFSYPYAIEQFIRNISHHTV